MKVLFLFCLLLISSVAVADNTPCETRALLSREKIKIGASAKSKPRTEAELKTIFNNVRADLIADISEGKIYSDLNSSQKLMVDRLNRRAFFLKKCQSEDTDTPGINDTYSNRIIICDYVKTAPTLALISLFGHELAHNLDLLNLGSRSLKVIQPESRIENLVDPPTFYDTTVGINLNDASDNRGTFYDADFEPYADKKEKLQRLINNGVIDVVDVGIPIERNPTTKTFACLSRQYANRPKPPASQIEAALGNYSTYGEESAQIWGARAVSLYLKKNSDMQPKDVLGLTRFVHMHADKAPEDKEDDLNQIYFSDTAVQRALKCEPAEKQNCMAQFRGNPAPTNTPDKTSQPVTGKIK